MGRLIVSMLALLACSVAQAADDVLVLMGGGASEDPEAKVRVQDALLEVGVGRVGFVTPEQLENSLGLVSVDSRAEDDACGGMILLNDWLRRLAGAEAAPASDDTLLAFSLLDLETACLDLLVSRSQLQRVQLGLVRVHLELAQRSTDAAGHRDSAATAAAGLWALGEDLPLPPELDPATERFILSAKPGFERKDVTIVAGGDAGRVYLDGQLVGEDPVVRAAGLHLVQVETSDVVLSAARPYLPEGDLVIWAGILTSGELRAEVDALATAGVDAPLLTAVEGLVGKRVVVASVEVDTVRL